MKPLLILIIIIIFYLSLNYRIDSFDINNNNNNNNNNNMRLVFFGDCMFGRDGNPFIENPFIYLEPVIKKATHLFLNLETTISPKLLPDKYRKNKVFTYQSSGDQMIEFRKMTNRPIFVSIVNNHSLDYGEKGHKNTKDFLRKNDFIHSSKNKVEHNNIVFLNATDHCGCENPKLWAKHIWMIDYNNLEPIYRRIRNIKRENKTIIFSIHWGSNWVEGDMPPEIKDFGRGLINAGVSIVYGHSAHHIVKNPVEEYKNGIIIYGLGDLINDYSINRKYNSDKALICIIEKRKNKFIPKLVKIKRKFIVPLSSVPTFDS